MIEIHIANRAAYVEHQGNTYWFLAATPHVDFRSILKPGVTFDAVIDQLRSLAEAALLRVSIDDTGLDVRAYRSITSNHEWFFYETDQCVLIADSFRNAIATLPLARREISDAALVDHLLFRTTPGHSTYASQVYRLGRGEKLLWTLKAGERKVDVCERLTPQDVSSLHAECVDRIDHSLGEFVSAVAGADSMVNLLSGGIDSTLLHTYFGRTKNSVSVAIDTPEFQDEIEYARKASALLGSTHEFIQIREDGYLSLLEDCIDGLGMPPHHLQTVLLYGAFTAPYNNFLTGEFADTLLGHAMDINRIAWWTRHITSSPIPEVTASFMPGIGNKLKFLRKRAHSVREDVFSNSGFGARYGVYSDVPRVKELFGDTIVEERLEERVKHTCERVDLRFEDPSDSFSNHVALGHFVRLFCVDTLTLWRQMAYPAGKTLFFPYMGRQVVESVVSIDSRMRYVKGLRSKYLLKDLLKQRLPEYPVDSKKGTTGLPFDRFYSSGPLKPVFEKYEVPDFVPDDLCDTLIERSDRLTWNLVTFAIWRDRILNNSSLRVTEGTRRYTLLAAAGHTAPSVGPAPQID